MNSCCDLLRAMHAGLADWVFAFWPLANRRRSQLGYVILSWRFSGSMAGAIVEISVRISQIPVITCRAVDG